MTTDIPTDSMPRPSAKRLLQAMALSLAAALVILFIAILPAEFGKDPTGLGGVLGFAHIYRPPASTAAGDGSLGTAAKAPATAVIQKAAPYRTETMTINIQPGKGTEVKATMREGDGLVFTWNATGGAVNFDLHGEPPNAGDSFTSHWKDRQKSSSSGIFIAPFMGTHGWYWGNKGATPVTITLNVSGFFEKIEQR